MFSSHAKPKERSALENRTRKRRARPHARDGANQRQSPSYVAAAQASRHAQAPPPPFFSPSLKAPRIPLQPPPELTRAHPGAYDEGSRSHDRAGAARAEHIALIGHAGRPSPPSWRVKEVAP